MKVEDIEIDKIKRFENVRIRVEDKDVHSMMSSVKQDGLLHPIGVSKDKKGEYYIVYGNRRLEACKKLGWKTIPAIIRPENELKEFYIKNTLENIERQELSETEIGRMFDLLMSKYDMTISELASRFGYPTARVRRAIRLYHHIPEEYRPKIKYLKDAGYKRGKIPATAANAILGMRRKYNLNKAQIKLLLDEAKKDGFTVKHLDVIGSLLQLKYNIDDALRLSKQYSVVSFKIPIKKKEIEKLTNEQKKSFSRIVVEILTGKSDIKLDIPKWQTIR